MWKVEHKVTGAPGWFWGIPGFYHCLAEFNENFIEINTNLHFSLPSQISSNTKDTNIFPRVILSAKFCIKNGIRDHFSAIECNFHSFRVGRFSKWAIRWKLESHGSWVEFKSGSDGGKFTPPRGVWISNGESSLPPAFGVHHPSPRARMISWPPAPLRA